MNLWLGIKHAVSAATKVISKHAPELLTGAAVAGTISTVVLAVKATPVAMDLIEDARMEKGEELTIPEKIRAAYKPYISAGLCLLATLSCEIGSASLNRVRFASMAGLYSSAIESKQMLEKHLVESIGKEKAEEVRASADQEAVNKVFKDQDGYVEPTNKGDWPIFDSFSGRLFYGSKQMVEDARNEINFKLSDGLEQTASYGEFYQEMNLEPSMGQWRVGWNHQYKMDDFIWGSGSLPTGRPYLSFTFSRPPKADYEDLNPYNNIL